MPSQIKKIIHVLGVVFGGWLILIGFFMNQPASLGAEGSGELLVTVFDVGQGDSILIETPDFQNILIDGGPDETILSYLGTHLAAGEEIDLMVLTHPHADHVSGLISVLDRYHVGRILATGVLHATRTYEEWLSRVRDSKSIFVPARAGQVFDLGDRVSLEVLYPFDQYQGLSLDDLPRKLDGGLNDTSVVLRLVYGDTAFLFMGDASKEVERNLMSAYSLDDLSAQILKVGHQGSDTSSGWDFLLAVDPEYGVISVGGNNYGHPNEVVLSRLRDADIDILRTDRHGSIALVSDGVRVWLDK